MGVGRFQIVLGYQGVSFKMFVFFTLKWIFYEIAHATDGLFTLEC